MSSTETVRRFDTHCHLDDPTLPDPLPVLLDEAAGVGVQAFLLPAVHPRDWPRAIAVSRSNPAIHLALGIHPFAVMEMADDALEDALDRLPGLLKSSGAVAIGEIGLDHRGIKAPEQRERQLQAFVRQLDIAHAVQLPTSIHCVAAHGPMLSAMQNHPVWGHNPGVLHGYTGSPQMVADYARGGLYFGFGGAITWPGARKPIEACRAVPADRLVLETDAPHQPPHPHRGEPGRPSWIELVARAAAAARGHDVTEQVWQNAHAVFGLDRSGDGQNEPTPA